ncbi:MAG: hypothetical protein JNK17_02175 [Hydrogenophaga sp.]|nr:hypothetical protein [Hydrogenophaga sp.]
MTTDDLGSVMRQRGKVVALLVVCGTVVALVHKESAGAVMGAVSLAVGALAGMEAWASKGVGK